MKEEKDNPPERKTFAVNGNKGFQIQFANGVVLSVQFGTYSYCEHYDTRNLPHDAPSKQESWNSKDAEIAMWDKDKEWITQEFEDVGDDVIGYVGIEKFLKVIDWCKNRT